MSFYSKLVYSLNEDVVCHMPCVSNLCLAVSGEYTHYGATHFLYFNTNVALLLNILFYDNLNLPVSLTAKDLVPQLKKTVGNIIMLH
jgi:hypothetical protein